MVHTAPRDAERNVVCDTIEQQTHATLADVERALAAARAHAEDIVKVDVYLCDLTLFARFNAVYATWFGRDMPTRTTVEAGLLPGCQ
jgi:2-iminobutanoate/2-iminopropanoate deaminase